MFQVHVASPFQIPVYQYTGCPGKKAIRAAHTFPSGSVYIKKGKGRGRMARQSYLKNAAILTGTGLLLRAAGMFFRIYIAARIGAEGMGLYQLIYTVYTMAVTLATAGLSVAATRLSAELLATDDPPHVPPRVGGILLVAAALCGFAAVRKATDT